MATDKEILDFKQTVKRYFRRHKRSTLPWRKVQTPYVVFVSELMLQQTQVERVIPKFTAFLQKFPSWRPLSKASLTEVYALWNGLGYNRRAKYLRDAAKMIMGKGGVLQNDPQFIESLPGVGPYMKGAIRAFTFGEIEPFVETNIRTAVMYHFCTNETGVSDSRVLSILEKCLPRRGDDARNWYAALMDYGSYLKKAGVRLNSKSATYTKQKKFAGSARQLRGAILRELLVNSQSEKSLATKTKRTDLEVRKEMNRLLLEGLIRKNGERYSLSH